MQIGVFRSRFKKPLCWGCMEGTEWGCLKKIYNLMDIEFDVWFNG